MRSRKIEAFLFCFLLIILTAGCDTQSKGNDGASDRIDHENVAIEESGSHETAENIPIEEMEKTLVEDSDMIPIYAFFDQTGQAMLIDLNYANQIALYNLSENKEVSICDIEAESIDLLSPKMLYFSDDFFIVYIGGEKIDKSIETGVDGLNMSSSSGEAETNRVYMINRDFSIRNEYDLSEISPEFDMATSGVCVNADGSELIIANNHSVLFYDFASDQLKEVDTRIQNQLKDIFIEEIAISSDGNRLAYLGSLLDVDEYSVYGIIDLQTMEVTTENTVGSYGYALHQENDMVYLTDNRSPYSGNASGIVICIDLQEGNFYDFTVDNLESTNASLSDDGKYLATAIETEQDGALTDCWLKVYDFETGKAVWKTKIEQAGKLDRIICQDGKMIVIFYNEGVWCFYQYSFGR